MATSQEECWSSGDRPDDDRGICAQRGSSAGVDSRQVTVRDLSIPASQARADPESRDIQDEEAGDTGDNGPDVGQSMHGVLEELYDPDFTDSNFGFRRGKNQHQAIRHLRERVLEGKEWAVAVDLKAFFDEIPHGLILKLIRRKVADERFVTMLARLLKAGVMIDGVFEKTTKGCPQGSPLSPMLSNIVLNELDHTLEEQNLAYCRWADDFVIVVRSQRAAKRVMRERSGIWRKCWDSS